MRLAAEVETEPKASLGSAFAKRLEVLKMSRREFARVSGISRQTMHKIEHEPNHVATDVTYQMLDQALEWAPGTARGLAEGSYVSVIRWRIIENLQSMSLTELEEMCKYIEAQELGSNPHVLMPTDELLVMVGEKLRQVRDTDTGDGTKKDGQSRRGNAAQRASDSATGTDGASS